MRISSAEGHGGAVARSRGQLDRGKLRDATRSAPAAGEAENSEIRIERVAWGGRPGLRDRSCCSSGSGEAAASWVDDASEDSARANCPIPRYGRPHRRRQPAFIPCSCDLSSMPADDYLHDKFERLHELNQNQASRCIGRVDIS